jgi:hypothetical protein
MIHLLSFWDPVATSAWKPLVCKHPMAQHEEATDQIAARIALRSEALSATRYASNKSVINDVDGWELLILHKR